MIIGMDESNPPVPTPRKSEPFDVAKLSRELHQMVTRVAAMKQTVVDTEVDGTNLVALNNRNDLISALASAKIHLSNADMLLSEF